MIVLYSRSFIWSSGSYTGDCAVTTCQCAQGDQWSVPGSQVIGQHMAITSPRLLITPCSITTTQLSLPTPLHGLVQRINSFLNNLHRSYFLVVGFKWGMILSLYARIARKTSAVTIGPTLCLCSMHPIQFRRHQWKHEASNELMIGAVLTLYSGDRSQPAQSIMAPQKDIVWICHRDPSHW